MKAIEFRIAAEKWVKDSQHSASKFPVKAGPNFLVDHRDGTAYEFSVWADNFGIAFDVFAEIGDDKYENLYMRAVGSKYANTLHYPRAAVDRRGQNG